MLRIYRCWPLVGRLHRHFRVSSVKRQRFRRRAISRPAQTRVNERIRIREVRLIDDEGQQVGIIPTREALEMARERGLDLVEVAPNASPPVCRLMDYGKFRYEQSRKERDSRRNQHVTRFLDGGDKVKLTVLFRGRSITHPELGRDLLDQLAIQLSEHGSIEQTARMEGRTMTMYMAPLRQRSGPSEREERANHEQQDQAQNA